MNTVPAIESPRSADMTRWMCLRSHRVFLVLGAVFGIALLGINPPFQAADESDHFKRIVQLSQGDVIGERHGTSAGGRIAAAAAAFLIFVAQYATWNAPRSVGLIEGICGRYFLPIVPFVIMSVPRLNPLPPRPTLVAYGATGLSMVGCIVGVAAVIMRYFVH